MPPTKQRLAQAKAQQKDSSKPKGHRSYDLKESSKRPIFGKGPTELRSSLKAPEIVSGPGQRPDTGILAVATMPEWYVYWALERLGKKPDTDFSYRAKTAYTSLSTDTQLDFTMLDGSGIAIEVQGTFWHYEQGAAKIVQDMVRSGALSRQWTVINIDEDDIVGDPTGQAAIYMVREALQGHDHSWRYRHFLRDPLKQA